MCAIQVVCATSWRKTWSQKRMQWSRAKLICKVDVRVRGGRCRVIVFIFHVFMRNFKFTAGPNISIPVRFPLGKCVCMYTYMFVYGSPPCKYDFSHTYLCLCVCVFVCLHKYLHWCLHWWCCRLESTRTNAPNTYIHTNRGKFVFHATYSTLLRYISMHTFLLFLYIFL